MDIIIGTLFFSLASISCLLGVITGLIRLRTSNVRQLHLFAVVVLAYLTLIYGLAAASRCGAIETMPILKNGTLTSMGVFFLSTMFIIMFIVGNKRHDR